MDAKRGFFTPPIHLNWRKRDTAVHHDELGHCYRPVSVMGIRMLSPPPAP